MYSITSRCKSETVGPTTCLMVNHLISLLSIVLYIIRMKEVGQGRLIKVQATKHVAVNWPLRQQSTSHQCHSIAACPFLCWEPCYFPCIEPCCCRLVLQHAQPMQPSACPRSGHAPWPARVAGVTNKKSGPPGPHKPPVPGLPH